MQRLLYILPVAAFGMLALILFRSLSEPPPSELASAMIGKAAPRLDLPALDGATQGFGPHDLAGHVTVVNIFASWCAPCRAEAPVMEALAATHKVQLYGLVQKDTPAKVRAFLAEVGNPFQRIALDADGRASIEWGVYGVPETFVIDTHGVIRARFVGEITPEILSKEVLPAIAAVR